MKNILKIAFLLCAVSGQAMGSDKETVLSDGGGGTQVEGQETTQRRSLAAGSNRRGRRENQPLTMQQIFGQTLRRPGMIMRSPLLNIQLNDRYPINFQSHYSKDEVYLNTMRDRLNSGTVKYETYLTEAGDLGNRTFVNLTQLEEPIIAQANAEVERLTAENQKLKTEAAKRWSGKTTFFLGGATVGLGCLAYLNRASLCGNYFAKKIGAFAPTTK